MALNPPTPSLRRLYYDAVSPAKVQIVVQPGDALHVSDDVAGQLIAGSAQFKDADAPKPPTPPPPPEPQADELEPEPEPEPAPRRTRKTKP